MRNSRLTKKNRKKSFFFYFVVLWIFHITFLVKGPELESENNVRTLNHPFDERTYQNEKKPTEREKKS